jgi:predicted membrane protein
MKKISSDIIIITILWISIIFSFCLTPNYNYPFIFGIVGLIIVTFSYKKFPDFSFGIFALILFLSIFDVITFSYALHANIGIFSLSSILLFAILFFTQLDKFLEIQRKWSEPDETELKAQFNNRVKIYKTQFRNLPESELHRKLENDHLTNEAKIAVSELLKEKSISHSTNSL